MPPIFWYLLVKLCSILAIIDVCILAMIDTFEQSLGKKYRNVAIARTECRS
jgi:hypothetical protein